MLVVFVLELLIRLAIQQLLEHVLACETRGTKENDREFPRGRHCVCNRLTGGAYVAFRAPDSVVEMLIVIG